MKINRDVNETTRQVIESLRDGPVFVTPDGKIVKETPSLFSFTVLTKNEEQRKSLVNKLKSLDYLVDLEKLPGLSRYFPQIFLKVDVENKTATNPLIVSINHFNYLREKESILAKDVLANFDELILNQNAELADSLVQYNKRR